MPGLTQVECEVGVRVLRASRPKGHCTTLGGEFDFLSGGYDIRIPTNFPENGRRSSAFIGPTSIYPPSQSRPLRNEPVDVWCGRCNAHIQQSHVSYIEQTLRILFSICGRCQYPLGSSRNANPPVCGRTHRASGRGLHISYESRSEARRSQNKNIPNINQCVGTPHRESHYHYGSGKVRRDRRVAQPRNPERATGGYGYPGRGPKVHTRVRGDSRATV